MLNKKKWRDDKGLEREVTIVNRLGLHARAAGLFRKTAASFQSEIEVVHEHITANAKSLIGLLALEGCQGTSLLIRAWGPDAEEAIETLSSLVADRFGEGE